MGRRDRHPGGGNPRTVNPTISVPDSADNLAPWADPGTTATPQECLESVERNGSYGASNVQPGEAFCLLTVEGRVA
ncbi:hypothetical protein [Streptomyces sp. NPDC098781]|uniref:hypothetical protein n=1 Tax=Streptomyces sp. NPDC098781 TaxID=3366097 RepID=UPI0038194D8B